MRTRSFATRSAYRGLRAYRADAGDAGLDLANNTNLFGSAPSAVATLAGCDFGLASYPSADPAALGAALAAWHGVDPGHVVCGCGSNDIIDSALRALVEPGGLVAHPAPTFLMAPHFAIANSLRTVAVPLLSDGDIDAAGLLATGADAIYVATPNNPTSRAASRQAIATLLERAPGVVILDEAYAEYAGSSWIQTAINQENVVVTRTFSKAWGLAGLRVGYGIGAPALVGEIEKARGPYKVNAIAERAARAAVSRDLAWLASIVAATRVARDSIAAELGACGYEVPASDANFLCVRLPDAGRAARHLAARRIHVRAFIRAPVIGDALRVTVGPAAVLEPFLVAMREIA